MLGCRELCPCQSKVPCNFNVSVISRRKAALLGCSCDHTSRVARHEKKRFYSLGLPCHFGTCSPVGCRTVATVHCISAQQATIQHQQHDEFCMSNLRVAGAAEIVQQTGGQLKSSFGKVLDAIGCSVQRR